VVAFEFRADEPGDMARMPSAVEQRPGDTLHADRAQEEVVGMAQGLPRPGRQSVERCVVVGFRPAPGVVVLGRVEMVVEPFEVRPEVMVQQVLGAGGVVGNDGRGPAGQLRGQAGIAHGGDAVPEVGAVEGHENDGTDARQVARADRVRLLPRFEVSAEGHADCPHRQGIGVFGEVERDHFAPAPGRRRLDGGQVNGNDGLGVRILHDEARHEFHEESEPGEGAGDGRRVESVAPAQQERVVELRDAPGLGQPGEDFGGAPDAPDEVMAASAQDMQRFDAVVGEDVFDRGLHRFLQREGAGRIEIGVGREIEIHILDVEVRQQRVAVGQGAADVASGLELRREFPRQEGLALGGVRVVRCDVFRGEVARLVGPEELEHARAHGGLAVIVAEGFGDVGHDAEETTCGSRAEWGVGPSLRRTAYEQSACRRRRRSTSDVTTGRWCTLWSESTTVSEAACGRCELQ